MKNPFKNISLLDIMLHSKLYNWGATMMKRIYFGDKGLSLYLVMAIFIKKLKNNDLQVKASAVAFNFTLAIFPAILFVFTLVPYLPIQDLREQIIAFFDDLTPNSMNTTIRETVVDIISKPRGNLLSFGFLSALYLASNGVNALIDAFNSCYHGAVKKRNFFVKRGVATMLTFLLSFILFFTIVALISGRVILDSLVSYNLLDENYIYYMIDVFRYLVVILMFFSGTSALYYFAPSIPRRWSFMSPGSILATTLIIGFSIGFSFYIDNFSTYNKLYGSIGVMLGVMLWLLAISYVLLIGFEVNSTIDVAKDRLQKLQEEMEASIKASWKPSSWRGTQRERKL